MGLFDPAVVFVAKFVDLIEEQVSGSLLARLSESGGGVADHEDLGATIVFDFRLLFVTKLLIFAEGKVIEGELILLLLR